MEFLEKNKTTDLLERAVMIADLANKCHRLGLIDDYQIKVDVTTEVDYEVDVRIDSYRSSEKRWCVSEASYREEQIAPTGDPDDIAAYLKKLIANRKALILSELEIMGE